MTEITQAFLAWILPVIVVFGVAALALWVIVWAIRSARRGKRAQAAADEARTQASTAVVELDNAVADLEIEVGISGALYGGDASAALRRARMNAQHARDTAFDDFRLVLDESTIAADRRNTALRIRNDAERALDAVQSDRRTHAEWIARNVDIDEQIRGARERLQEIENARQGSGAFLAELEDRFDLDEWSDAAHAFDIAEIGLAEARAALETAAAQSADPSESALGSLATAERSLAVAEEARSRIEDDYRRVLQSALGVQGEIASARADLRAALSLRDELSRADGERLSEAIDAAEAEIARLAASADRRPTETVDGIARVREQFDNVAGSVRSDQQRVRSARAAQTGALAAARNAIAHAIVAVQRPGVSAEPRVRLATAQSLLADTREGSDPVTLLETARRSRRHADEARALAEEDLRRD